MTSSCKLIVAAVAMAALAAGVNSAAAEPAPSAGCAASAADHVVGEFTHEKWPIAQKRRLDGAVIQRTYTVHVPPQHRQQEALPIVFDLHGALTGASGFQQNLASEMSAKGAAEGFIVAQPNSWPWWAGSPIEESLRGGLSDVEYVTLLLDTFDRNLCFDRNRIFVAGGGTLIGSIAQPLACASAKGELKLKDDGVSYKIAAAAMVSASPIPSFQALPWEKTPRVSLCPELKADPVPLLVIVSDNDLRFASLLPPAQTPPQTTAVSFDMSDSTARAEFARFMDADNTREVGATILRELPADERTKLAAIDPEEYCGKQSEPAALRVLKGSCCATGLWGAENGCSNLGLVEFLGCKPLTSASAPPPDAEWGHGWGVEGKRIGSPFCGRKKVNFIVFGTGAPERNGHVWPGKSAGTPFIATDEIWKFFKAHPR